MKYYAKEIIKLYFIWLSIPYKIIIVSSIRLKVLMGGFGKDVNGYMSLGSAHDFITKIVPISCQFSVVQLH